MGLITPIYIKPDKYFYNYYNDYINKHNNSESDYFILNLLKCKSKLITPTFITKNNLQDYNNCKILEQKKKINISKKFYNNFKSNVINNNHICNICYEQVSDNYVITQCLHTYCIKCANTLYFNNTTNNTNIQQSTETNIFSFKKGNHSINKQEFKCPTCSHTQNKEHLFLLTNKILSDIENKKENKKHINFYLSLIKVLYNTVLSVKKKKFTYNVNKNFIYKYIGYKTYYILNKIVENKTPFNIIENDITNYNKTHHIKIILSNNPKWIELMNIIITNNNIHLCLIGNMPQYIDELINTINTSINKNKFINFHLYLVDPYDKKKYDAIKSNLNNLILNISSSDKGKYKNIKILPYQLVIKNTIDEKIFTNKVIIT
jgi:hypothetical protein